MKNTMIKIRHYNAEGKPITDFERRVWLREHNPVVYLGIEEVLHEIQDSKQTGTDTAVGDVRRAV